jgi:hypothetical protein
MITEKAAKEMWGIPKRQPRIRGTSSEQDIIQLEHVISSCDIFVLHNLMPMNKDHFWSVIHPRVNVGSPWDHDKIHISYTEHKQELVNRIVLGKTTPEYTNHNMKDDDQPLMSNEDSICSINSKGVNMYNTNKADSEDDMTDDEHAVCLANSLKKLGNMSCKPLDRYAPTDLFAHSKVLLGTGLHKTRHSALARIR